MPGEQNADAVETLSFGRLLRELRLEAGLSQEALAERAGMSTGGIGVLERGVRRAPQRDTLELLAQGLRLSDLQRERLSAAARRAGNYRRRRQTSAQALRPRNNLPYSLSSFIGRERAIAGVQNDVRDHRLVTITGTGGVGKTRLAVESAHGLAGTFSDGLWLVELASLRHADLVEERIAETLQIAQGPAAIGDAWLEPVADKHLLLILDNCEHLLAACATVAKRMLERCPHLRLLTTSREPLRLAGERIVRLDPLEGRAAVELFVDRARDASPKFEETAGIAEALHDLHVICKQLDGIPFAIELAAARTATLSLRTLANNIDQRLKLFRHEGLHASDPRHATMRALIDWSYDRLADDERRVFEDLAIFSGGCTLETATNICKGDSEDAFNLLETLTSLVAKSMVVVDFDRGEPRYGLLEVLREYGREKLAGRGALEHVTKRHALAYLDLAGRLDAGWNRWGNRAHAQVRAELENWRSALAWTLGERHDVVLGQRLLGALSGVFTTFAIAEGERWCVLALALIDDATPRDVTAPLQYTQARIAFVGGNVPAALVAAEQALEGYHALNDAVGSIRAQVILGRILLELGRSSESETTLREALESARRLDEQVLAASALQGLALNRSMVGDLEAVRAYVAETLRIAKAAPADRLAVLALTASADAHATAGDPDESIRLAEEALSVARALGDDFAMAIILANLASYHIRCDRTMEARNAARQSLELLDISRPAGTVTWALQHLALVAALNSSPTPAVAKADHVRAAKLFGFTAARFAALKIPGTGFDQRDRARLAARLSDVLDAAELEHLTATGAELTEAQAIQEGLAI